NCVVTEIWQTQTLHQHSAVCMWIGSHPAITTGSKRSQFRSETTSIVEQLIGPIASHPLFEQRDVFRLLVHLAHWYLVAAPVIFDLFAIDFARAGPAFRRSQNNH